ncbi:hypothetical protein ElyMa_006171500 [Elysia marginata]|uniref:Uncharacterized protein n=1 Tax=Elysia marginata TaxID=1093978 RepID=A0AAV4H395_9GAST|nr:hypothetical protein ElyMa_006171500 [Elysia marginata]
MKGSISLNGLHCRYCFSFVPSSGAPCCNGRVGTSPTPRQNALMKLTCTSTAITWCTRCPQSPVRDTNEMRYTALPHRDAQNVTRRYTTQRHAQPACEMSAAKTYIAFRQIRN